MKRAPSLETREKEAGICPSPPLIFASAALIESKSSPAAFSGAAKGGNGGLVAAVGGRQVSPVAMF